MRQNLYLAAAVAALAVGMSPAQALPFGAMQDAAGAASQTVQVQYWGGGWGPRYDEPRYEPRFREPRYLDPEPETDAIHPGEAVTITRSMGYRATTRPRLVQGAWVMDTIDRQGLRVRVSIDAFSGRPLRVRYIDPQGPRFGTPPVWPEERPNFQSRDGRQPMQRDGRLEQDFDRPGQQRPEQRPERPQRAAKPERDITARLVPVPVPRPQIDPPGMVPPAVLPPVAIPPADATPAAPPPAARIAPQDQPLSVEPRIPFTPPAAPPVQEATPPAPIAPAPPPTAALPPAPVPEPPVVVPTPEIGPPPQATPVEPPVPAPPTAALPPAPVEPPPAPVITPVPTVPAPVEAAPAVPPATPPTAAARPAEPDDGVMVDGRFLGPNGETLPGAPEPRAGVRQVTPQGQPAD